MTEARDSQNTSLSYPTLSTAIGMIRTAVDKALPDNLLNDAAGLQTHFNSFTEGKISTDKIYFKKLLNYAHETIRKRKEWHSRNQQYSQLQRDEKKLSNHIKTCKERLEYFIDTSRHEINLRIAESEGRLASFKVIFQLEKMCKHLSKGAVKLEMNVEPPVSSDETTISMYCDSFVLDVILIGKEAGIKSATLMHIVKESTRQDPMADEDLLYCVKELRSGKPEFLETRIEQLVERSILSLKYPNQDFFALEDTLLQNLREAVVGSEFWEVCRMAHAVAVRLKGSEKLGAAGWCGQFVLCTHPSGQENLCWVLQSLNGPALVLFAASAVSDLANLLYVGKKSEDASTNEKYMEGVMKTSSKNRRDMFLKDLFPSGDCLHTTCIEEQKISKVAKYSLALSNQMSMLSVTRLAELPLMIPNANAEVLKHIIATISPHVLWYSLMNSCFNASNSGMQSNQSPVAVRVTAAPPSQIELKTRTVDNSTELSLRIRMTSDNVDPALTVNVSIEPETATEVPCTSEQATKLIKKRILNLPGAMHSLLLTQQSSQIDAIRCNGDTGKRGFDEISQ